MTGTAESFGCPSCSASVRIEELLGGGLRYSSGTMAFTSSCPLCAKEIEFQARAGRLTIGYTYWAGSFHFEGLFDVPARGIRADLSPDSPSVSYGGSRHPAAGR